MGRLQVQLCGARKLHDNQVVGIPDPYAKVSIEGRMYKTKVAKNTLNPVWDETFTFQVADDNSSQLLFELWNHNILVDNVMGTYTLSVGGLTRGVVQDNWFILARSKTNAELHVRVLAVDFGRLPRPDEQWMVTTDINNDPQRAGAAGKAGKQPYAVPPPMAQPIPPVQYQPAMTQPLPGGSAYAMPPPQPPMVVAPVVVATPQPVVAPMYSAMPTGQPAMVMPMYSTTPPQSAYMPPQMIPQQQYPPPAGSVAYGIPPQAMDQGYRY